MSASRRRLFRFFVFFGGGGRLVLGRRRRRRLIRGGRRRRLRLLLLFLLFSFLSPSSAKCVCPDGPSPARTKKLVQCAFVLGHAVGRRPPRPMAGLGVEAEAADLALRRQCFERLVQLLELAVLHRVRLCECIIAVVGAAATGGSAATSCGACVLDARSRSVCAAGAAVCSECNAPTDGSQRCRKSQRSDADALPYDAEAQPAQRAARAPMQR